MAKLQMGYSVFHVVKLIGNFKNVLIEFLSFYITVYLQRASMVVQMVKNLPVVQETRVQSLGREDPWRREWQPTPVFLPGESHGPRSLVRYNPWGHKESDTTQCYGQSSSIRVTWKLLPIVGSRAGFPSHHCPGFPCLGTL